MFVLLSDSKCRANKHHNAQISSTSAPYQSFNLFFSPAFPRNLSVISINLQNRNRNLRNHFRSCKRFGSFALIASKDPSSACATAGVTGEMKSLQCFKQSGGGGNGGGQGKRLERRLSLGEYKKAVSWSKYLVAPPGARIRGGSEELWSADLSKLEIRGKFATGRHSRVYSGRYAGREVAIKMVSQPEEDAALAVELERQFASEVALLLRLRHPNIISFVAACKKPPVFCIITEFMAGGSLRKYLHQQEPHSVPIELVLKLALDIARGMSYLHSQGILHRDLKSENILLGADMSVKVADFGISCLESQCGSGKGFTGTYRWMAPEMIKEKHHTRKVDVYSFGIVMWEILTSLVPFSEMTPEQAAVAVALKNARPPLPASCPVAISHLITQCWATNPDKRPQFDDIVAILESYKEALDEDPSFFLSYIPPPMYHHHHHHHHHQHQQRLLRCFPRCGLHL